MRKEGRAISSRLRDENLAVSILAQAEARPELTIGTVDDQLALSQALRWAAGRARILLDEGLRPGERIALMGSNSTDYLVTWLACLLAGIPVALVNPAYPADLIDRMLEPLRPERLLGVDDIARAREVEDDPAGSPGLDCSPSDIASFMHTSGTTGVPKFCVQTHDYFQRLGAHVADFLDLGPQDRVLAPLPYFHINPLGYGFLGGLLAGADTLTISKFSASRFWPTVVVEGVTALILHAPPVEILKRAVGPEAADGHRVRTMFFADGEFMTRFGVPNAVSGYGSTEAGGLSHLQRWRLDDGVPEGISRHGGHPRSDIEWRLDGDGIIEVRERAAGALFGGYVTESGMDPARAADGWFHTGDLGRSLPTDESYLVFVERVAESIRVKGEYVPIPWVENRLATVSGLQDLALWKRRGELVDDELVLYAVADDLPVAELSGRIAELPVLMRPTVVARVAALPRDEAVGKVRRRLLPELDVLEWVDLR